MTQTTARPRRGGATGRGRPRADAAPPILVRMTRGGTVESVHRGDIVEVDVEGRVLRLVGDAERTVTLRSTVKPFALLALVEAGGIDAFDLEAAELAVMTSSHAGEDSHVRTIQAMLRRAGVSQQFLACGTEDAPLDALTAARLARDGERPSAIRHMCSGQHAGFLLLAKLGGWDPAGYWRPEHPVQVTYREVVGRVFATAPGELVTAIDACGVETFAFPLRVVAQAFALLAEPDAISAADPRVGLAGPLVVVRDAMLAHPEMVAGSRDRLDTSVMKAVPGRVISKSGAEGLYGVAVRSGPRSGSLLGEPSGLAVKIEDGDLGSRAGWAATVEALHQAGVVDGQAFRVLGRYHRPSFVDPHGRAAGEAVPSYELAPVGELIG